MADFDNQFLDFDDQLLQFIRQRQNNEALEILKNWSGVVQLADRKRKTLLHFAAKSGNDKVAEYLLESSADINAQDSRGNTPLILAARSLRIDKKIIDILLKFNANIHICDKGGLNALQHSSNETRVKILRKLSEQCSGDAERIAAKLISWECAVICGLPLKNAELTRQLLARGCPVECSKCYMISGQTALTQAILSGDLENVKALLKHGVDVNADSRDEGFTALSAYVFTSEKRNSEILRLLLEGGVSLTRLMRRGGTSCLQGQMQMLTILKYCERMDIRLLLQRDVDLCAKDAHGCTAIHYIAGNMHTDVFKELQGRKYDVNARDNEGKTPLHYINMMSLKVANALLDEGADVDTKDNHGITPLLRMWFFYKRFRHNVDDHVAYQDFERVIECLLRHNADPQVLGPLNTHSIFNSNGHHGFNHMKPMLVHLALIEARGIPIERDVRYKINEHTSMKEYFEKCIRQIEEMKKVEIWKSITLYDLLVAKDIKIEGYARNERLLMNLRRMKYQNKYIPYYIYFVRDRIVKAVKIVSLRKEVAEILCQAVGLCQNSHTTIIDKITGHLCIRDLRKLSCEK